MRTLYFIFPAFCCVQLGRPLQAQVWAGEDGPISGGEDGTCGGVFPNGSSTNTSVCGTYATVPWYANDLVFLGIWA